MNEIYLSGKVISVFEPEGPASQPKHLMYQLRVSHKTSQQQVKHENYSIHVWRNTAIWTAANIHPGMEVLVRGHLSQRLTTAGAMTEVTALHIIPVTVQYVNAMAKPSTAPGVNCTEHSMAEQNLIQNEEMKGESK